LKTPGRRKAAFDFKRKGFRPLGAITVSYGEDRFDPADLRWSRVIVNL
jgi:hypothetical protein